MEVVPLYGDMMIAPFNFIKQTPNYDPDKWTHCTSEKNNAQGQITKVIRELREQHLHLVTQLTLKGKHKRFMEQHSEHVTTIEHDHFSINKLYSCVSTAWIHV